jgi:hypothetical protein
MRNLFVILFLFLLSTHAYAFPKGESFAERLNGTWQIKNVQKMQGLVIRTQKYTKDGGDPKAFIARLKGCTVTFNMDSTVTLVTANGKKTIEGKWYFGYDTKYRVKTGANALPGDNGHTEEVSIFKMTFPTARSYNIEGNYDASQFGVGSVKGRFAVIDPKYMFKFKKVDEEVDASGDEDDKDN